MPSHVHMHISFHMACSVVCWVGLSDVAFAVYCFRCVDACSKGPFINQNITNWQQWYIGALGAMSTQGTVGPFVPGCEDWVSYTECLQHYFDANNVDSATKQCTILLSSCGADTSQLSATWSLLRSQTTFKQIVVLVKVHYCLQPSVIVQFHLYQPCRSKTNRQQSSWQNYAVDCHISEHCQFARSLRDRLVCGIRA